MAGQKREFFTAVGVVKDHRRGKAAAQRKHGITFHVFKDPLVAFVFKYQGARGLRYSCFVVIGELQRYVAAFGVEQPHGNRNDERRLFLLVCRRRRCLRGSER